jgi:hypothetical protein
MFERSAPWLPVLFLILALAVLSQPSDATAQAADPALAAWYEEARAYYRAVVNVTNRDQHRPCTSAANRDRVLCHNCVTYPMKP